MRRCAQHVVRFCKSSDAALPAMPREAAAESAIQMSATLHGSEPVRTREARWRLLLVELGRSRGFGIG